MNFRFKKVGIFVFISILVAVVAVYFFMSGDSKLLQSTKITFVKNVEPTPTPFLFQEMTIPYLRNREFKSSIGELKQISKNSLYTSYITNYVSDNLKVNALLTKPEGDTPSGGFPAIVFVHGYIPPKSYKTLVNYESYVDYLARQGFVVFKIDLRGHGDSEGEAGGGYYSSDYVFDTLNAVSALKALDFVNPKSIGLWGHSMAGNVVLRSLAVDTDIPAVVIWAGAGYTYTDLLTYRIQDTSYRPPTDNTQRQKKRQLLRDTYGEFDGNHWFWRQVPATNYLEGIVGAIQLNHASDDNVVSIDYSRNLNNLLDKTTIIHKFNEYPSGGHNISGENFSKAMKNTVEFFAKHL